MITTLEYLRNLLYSSPLDGNLFERWCLINYLRDIYEQTGCMQPEYEYIKGFYPPEEYDFKHFLDLDINPKKDTGTLYVYKHLSYTTYYKEGNFSYMNGREIYYEDVDYHASQAKILFFEKPLQPMDCKPFDLEESKIKMQAQKILINKDSFEIEYLSGSTNIQCISKKIKEDTGLGRKRLEAQNPLLAKYYHGKGGWTKGDCYLEDTFID